MRSESAQVVSIQILVLSFPTVLPWRLFPTVNLQNQNELLCFLGCFFSSWDEIIEAVHVKTQIRWHLLLL